MAKLFKDFFSKGFFYWSNFARSTIVQGFFFSKKLFFTGTSLLVAKLFRYFFGKGFFYWNVNFREQGVWREPNPGSVFDKFLGPQVSQNIAVRFQ